VQVNQALPEKVLDKKKIDQFSRPYAAKARTLLHAHLYRMHEILGRDTLLADLNYILRKCPMLIQDMISVIVQMTMMKMAGECVYHACTHTLQVAGRDAHRWTLWRVS
jgi:translocation protein SEC63